MRFPSPRVPLRRRLVAAFALAAALAAVSVSARAAGPPSPPVAPVRNVVDTHWGVKVDDPYRYMENLDDPEVRAWIRAQSDFTRSILDRMPERDALLARLQELDAGKPHRIWGVRRMPDGRLFYFRQDAGENLARLCTRPSLDGAEAVLVDPSRLATADGGHFALSLFEPSPDGRRVAYALAPSGSEQDVLYVLDVASLATLPDSITRLEAAYTNPMWLPDGSGFFYSRRRELPADAPETEGYRLTKAYLHRLGTPVADDPPVLAHGQWPNAAMSEEDFPSIVLTPGSPWAIGQIKHGDANQLTLVAARIDALLAAAAARAQGRPAASPWEPVCDVPDSVTEFAVHGEMISLVTSVRAPRFQVVRTPLPQPAMDRAEVLVPPGEEVVTSIAAAKDGLYIGLRRGAATGLARLGHAHGARLERLALPDGYESGKVAAADAGVNGVLVETASWTRAGRTYAYDPVARTFTDTGLVPPGRHDELPGYAATVVEVPSHDGVRVPLTILHREGVRRDGKNPTLLVGYGAYGLSQNVAFTAARMLWLERGGILAIAHVRGGGEKGQEWHAGGQKLTKPNTWKDFIACAEYLVREKYTAPRFLAGQGGSAGGILVGRAVTERPDLFEAALFDVGSLDAIRMETTTNGVPNIQEFGTVTKEDEFRALLEMSAYHHVRDGVKYPAVMVSHGLNDPRVEPWTSAKMVARMQAATGSGKPVLFRVDAQAGHGIGSTRAQSHALVVDRYVFLLWRMGLLKPLP